MQILVAEDETNVREVVAEHLTRLGYTVRTARDGMEALEKARAGPPDLLITDLRMPRMDGLTLVDRCHELCPDTVFIVLTAHASVESAIGALRRGVHDYISKPFNLADLTATVAKVLRHAERSKEEVSRSPEEAAQASFQRIVGGSLRMQRVLRTVQQAAASDSTILMTGESGTGKELVARMTHDLSDRGKGPYVVVHCAALPESLIEAELFGFERGAFTGAVERKPGRFELAHGGTLFLDEVAEIPVHVQVKLLRVLQTKQFERIGGVQTVHSDIRLVAATHQDLRREVAEGRFRADLYYRLNVVPVELPPLRERLEDIPLLVEHLLERLRSRTRREVNSVTPEAMQLLMSHSWPGNVRELENVLERAMVLSLGTVIRDRDLPAELSLPARSRALTMVAAGEPPAGPRRPPTPGLALKHAMKETCERVERDLIREALQTTRWNRTRAAKLLGISRRGLHTKIMAYELGRDGDG